MLRDASTHLEPPSEGIVEPLSMDILLCTAEIEATSHPYLLRFEFPGKQRARSLTVEFCAHQAAAR